MSDSCEKYRVWLKEEIAGELDPRNEASLSRHLLDCPACSREKADLEATWKALKEFEPEPVPRHFFVYEEPKAGLLHFLRQLSLGWKLLVGTAVATGLMGWALVATQTRISLGKGTLTVMFGEASGQERSTEEAELKASLVRLIQDLNADLKQNLKAEISATLDRQGTTSRQEAATLAKQFDQKLESSLKAQEERLQSGLDSALNRSVRLVMAGHREDMVQIQRTLTRFASIGLYQADQANAVAATLTSLTKPPADPKGGK